jgi:2-keto-4-pentenoate hydratase
MSGAIDRDGLELARRLTEARSTRVPVPRPTNLASTMARAVRRRCIEILTNEGSIPIAGYKVSLSTPTWGALTDKVVLTSGASLPRRALIDPLLEGELAFVVETELSPSSTLADIVDGCSVAPAIEIADSRWEGWHPSAPARFVVPSGAEIEADNAVSGWLVLGESWAPARELPLPELQISMRTNGRTVARGVLQVAMGHPAEAVRWLIEQLAADGRSLDVGQVVSSGCPYTEPVTVTPAGGTWEAVVEEIGAASVTFT